MKLTTLNEDKKLPKLPVTLSSEIIERIDKIVDYNNDKKEEISNWYEGIEGFKNYISNPTIAWDNNDKFTHSPNGETIIKELGFEASYIIKTNKKTGKNYIYVFKLTLKPDEFGLDIPSDLKESKQNITFNNLYSPIKTSYVLSYEEFCKHQGFNR